MAVNIMLVTHNARMRCFLEDVIKEKMDSYRSDHKVKEIRFKNSSILLLRIINTGDHKYTTELSLIYDGYVNKPKTGAYFVSTPAQNTEKIKYIQFENIITNLRINMKVNQNYDIYIIRHGEATHNKATLNINRDTPLTQEGREQAALVSSFFRNFDKIDYFFSSRLIRTRETLEYIIRGLNRKIYTDHKIIVLPCSHELYYNEKGNCDMNASGKPVPLENIKKCSGKNDEKCNKIDYCCKTPSMGIDWSYYAAHVDSKKRCRDANMIQLIISYVETNNLLSNKENTMLKHQGGNYFHEKYLKIKSDYQTINTNYI